MRKSNKPFPNLSNAIIIFFLFLAVQLALGLVFTLVFLCLGSLQEDLMLNLTLVNILTFYAVYRYCIHKAEYNINEILVFKIPNIRSVVAFVIGLLGLQLVFSELSNVIMYYLNLPQDVLEFLESLMPMGSGLSTFFLLVVVASLTEEIIFRGFILKGFLRNYGMKKAVLYSSILFALLHLSPLQIPGTFILGIVFALVAIDSKSLLTPILAHAYNNGIAFLYMTLGAGKISGIGNKLSDPVEFHPLWLDITGVICLIIGIILCRQIYMDNKDKYYQIYCNLQEIDKSEQ